jgi:uncharacterized protein (TIGR02145 family)
MTVTIDGVDYESIEIGTQEWLTVNLRTTKFNDDTDIPVITGAAEWMAATSPAMCYYDNANPSGADVAKFGALYNGYAVHTGKIAPDGWRIPSEDDLNVLRAFAGGGDPWGDGATELASTTDWNVSTTPNTPGYNPSENNTLGFNGLPAGLRGLAHSGGAFSDRGNSTSFVSTTLSPTNVPRTGSLVKNYANLYIAHLQSTMNVGYPIRLVRDVVHTSTKITSIGGKTEYGTDPETNVPIVSSDGNLVNISGGEFDSDWGAGDAVTVSGSTYYVEERLSSTQLLLQTWQTITPFTDEAFTIARAYTGIAAWEAATGGDLVTAKQCSIGVCYDDMDPGSFATITIAGATTSVEYYRTLTVAQGHRHLGRFSAGAVTASKFSIEEPYFRMEHLRISNPVPVAGSTDLYIIDALGGTGRGYVTLNSLLIHDWTHGAIGDLANSRYFFGIRLSNNKGCRVFNSAVVNLTKVNNDGDGGSISGIFIGGTSAEQNYIANNAVLNLYWTANYMKSDGGIWANANTYLYNNISAVRKYSHDESSIDNMVPYGTLNYAEDYSFDFRSPELVGRAATSATDIQNYNHNEEYIQTDLELVDGVTYALEINMKAYYYLEAYRETKPFGENPYNYDSFGVDDNTELSTFKFTLTRNGTSISAVADPTNPTDSVTVFDATVEAISGYTDAEITTEITIPGNEIIGSLRENLNFSFSLVDNNLKISGGNITQVEQDYEDNVLFFDHEGGTNPDGDYARIYSEEDSFYVEFDMTLTSEEILPLGSHNCESSNRGYLKQHWLPGTIFKETSPYWPETYPPNNSFTNIDALDIFVNTGYGPSFGNGFYGYGFVAKGVDPYTDFVTVGKHTNRTLYRAKAGESGTITFTDVPVFDITAGYRYVDGSTYGPVKEFHNNVEKSIVNVRFTQDDISFDSTTKNIYRVSGSFIDDGFTSGTTIRVKGASNSGNNKNYSVTGVSDTVLSTSTTMTTEISGATIYITKVPTNTPTYSLSGVFEYDTLAKTFIQISGDEELVDIFEMDGRVIQFKEDAVSVDWSTLPVEPSLESSSATYNFITNGDFTNAVDYWTYDPELVTFSGGQCICYPSASIKQTIPPFQSGYPNLVIGNTYRLSVDFVNARYAGLYLGSTYSAQDLISHLELTIPFTGTLSFTFVATTTEAYLEITNNPDEGVLDSAIQNVRLTAEAEFVPDDDFPQLISGFTTSGILCIGQKHNNSMYFSISNRSIEGNLNLRLLRKSVCVSNGLNLLTEFPDLNFYELEYDIEGNERLEPWNIGPSNWKFTSDGDIIAKIQYYRNITIGR